MMCGIFNIQIKIDGMKRIIYIMTVMLSVFLVSQEAFAQMGKKHFFNAGWQFNGTLDNNVATTAQGYGAYFEAGHYLAPNFAVGGFVEFSTNNEYIGKKTYYFEDKAALTTDLDKSLYQLPFGAMARYRFSRGVFQPYFQAKVGAEYSTQSMYMSTFMNRENNWGLYLSPELGFTVFPFEKHDFGFHFAVYYSYASNENDDYDMEGINNLGFKLGVAF